MLGKPPILSLFPNSFKIFIKHEQLCKILYFANSADPDEMLPYAAFHLGLYCLSKYLFIGIQNERLNMHANVFSRVKGVRALRGYFGPL